MEEKNKNELYYNLLLRRENLIKDGKQIYCEYVKCFGELLIKRYEILMEIAKLRKMISFCVKKQNYGKRIKADELDSYIELEMVSYHNELNQLIQTKNDVESLGMISVFDEKKCKKLYYDIAKKIHPDLHPNVSEEMIKIFNEAKDAYENNDLPTLERLHDMVSLYNDEETIIDDIEEKITKVKNDINELETKEPYILKYEYSPEEMRLENIKRLKEEIESSQVILEHLQREFEQFEIVNEVM